MKSCLSAPGCRKRDHFCRNCSTPGCRQFTAIDGRKLRNGLHCNPYVKARPRYGDDYIKALQLAKVALGLLSKGNRDLHTNRTFEIPYCGGLLCAERTSEYLELYQEDIEAVYWSDVSECIEKCKKLLNDEKRRADIAGKGRLRCLRNGIFNESNLNKMLEAAFSQ